jgi:hypothetical protein
LLGGSCLLGGNDPPSFKMRPRKFGQMLWHSLHLSVPAQTSHRPGGVEARGNLERSHDFWLPQPSQTRPAPLNPTATATAAHEHTTITLLLYFHTTTSVLPKYCHSHGSTASRRPKNKTTTRTTRTNQYFWKHTRCRQSLLTFLSHTHSHLLLSISRLGHPPKLQDFI